MLLLFLYIRFNILLVLGFSICLVIYQITLLSCVLMVTLCNRISILVRNLVLNLSILIYSSNFHTLTYPSNVLNLTVLKIFNFLWFSFLLFNKIALVLLVIIRIHLLLVSKVYLLILSQMILRLLKLTVIVLGKNLVCRYFVI